MSSGNWEAVIGLEVHVQLATASKAFSSSAVAFGQSPNSLADPVVLGLPGALPVFNERALEHAVRLGLAVGSTIRTRSRFARKHYFYPDLPKGYQISQFDEPICEGGAVELVLGGERRAVRLIRIHLEEDAGKSTHTSGGVSMVDLNRAGVPLCEVVSQPDLRSAAEAAEYMRSLRQLVRYLDISEGDMEKGQLRCDANVSVRPRGQSKLGTRAELKNINSFKFVEKAIDHEIARQIGLLEAGGEVVQETRLWDSDAGVSRSMRGKEEALDYRYFPDPDLPPVEIDASRIDALRATLPELPVPTRLRYVKELGLSEDDARTLSAERPISRYFDATVAALGGGAEAARSAANWITAELYRELNRLSLDILSCPVQAEALAELIGLTLDGTVSGKIAKGVLSTMFETGEGARAIVEREGLVQISDSSALEALVDEVIANNPKQTEQYRSGKDSLFGYFVGQVMKASKGQANPRLVNELLRKKLGG